MAKKEGKKKSAEQNGGIITLKQDSKLKSLDFYIIWKMHAVRFMML